MAIIVKKEDKTGNKSNHQIISEFTNLTRFDPVLEKVKEKLMFGHKTESFKRNEKNKVVREFRAWQRRKSARRRGTIK